MQDYPTKAYRSQPQNYPSQQQGYPTGAYQSPPANPSPPQQNYPPQQEGYPVSAFRSHPQGYPSANQYQPQASNSDQSSNEFNQGLFQGYKVVLVILVLKGLMELPEACRTFSHGSNQLYSFMMGLLGLALIAVAVLQFLAMKDRDLWKANYALIGFIGWYVLSIINVIVLWLRNLEYISFDGYVLGIFVTFSVLFALGVTGSLQVYKRLGVKQIEPESMNYQNYY